LTALLSVSDQSCQPLDKLRIIAARHDKTSFSVFDQGWNVSGSHGHYRTPASHCLHDDIRATFNI
jgi:hypothetical protein